MGVREERAARRRGREGRRSTEGGRGGGWGQRERGVSVRGGVAAALTSVAASEMQAHARWLLPARTHFTRRPLLARTHFTRAAPAHTGEASRKRHRSVRRSLRRIHAACVRPRATRRRRSSTVQRCHGCSERESGGGSPGVECRERWESGRRGQREGEGGREGGRRREGGEGDGGSERGGSRSAAAWPRP